MSATGIPGGLSDHFHIEEMPVQSAAAAPLLLTVRQSHHSVRLDTLAGSLLAGLRMRSVLLVRGLGAKDASSTAACADRIFAGEAPFQTAEHPQIDAAASVYRPVRFAPSETLLWHHENSFNATFPRFLMFVSAVPADHGGETSIVDSRLVYAQMTDDVRRPLAAHGVRYKRQCDGHAGRTWQQVYGTMDPDTAMEKAANGGEELVFTPNGARIQAIRPAFATVPYGTSWFNQILHWHPRALPAELREMTVSGRLPMYRTCSMGNHAPISDAMVDRLIEAHRDVEYLVRWRPGDILLIDNLVIAHGRRPYRGRREHFVRMAGIEALPPVRARS